LEAIILAGGFGTRISSVVKDLPKSMAPVNNKPFLHYILAYLAKQRVSRVILSVGYREEVIREFFGNAYDDIEIVYSKEEKPLGTGGAIKKGLPHARDEHVFVLNGDSIFKIDYQKFMDEHLKNNALLSLALKHMSETDRYGTVKVSNNRVTEFVEKKNSQNCNINTGLYIARKDLFELIDLPEEFSFEHDFMEKYVTRINICAFCYEGYFIDIGIPEDYFRAQKEF
jgi:D-glycero-alpha-D-manno-heptose 1-phosphate guanylyltransferase